MNWEQELLIEHRDDLREHIKLKDKVDEGWYNIRLEGLLDSIDDLVSSLETSNRHYQGPPFEGGGYKADFIRCSRCNSGFYEPDTHCTGCNIPLLWDAPPRRYMTELEWAEYDNNNPHDSSSSDGSDDDDSSSESES